MSAEHRLRTMFELNAALAETGTAAKDMAFVIKDAEPISTSCP